MKDNKISRSEMFAEKPDYKHYPACLGRMNTIKAYGTKCFFYTTAVCFLMGVLTLFGMRFNIISFIPDLIGAPEDVTANLVQGAILIGITVMSALATGKMKVLGVVINVLYILMMLSCLFTNKFSDVFTFFIGAVGTAMTFRATGYWLDYQILSQTEGFPHFNERLAVQDEVTEYEEYYNKASEIAEDNISQTEENNAPEAFAEKDDITEMASIEAVGSSEQSELRDIKIYKPCHKKFCEMRESAVRIPHFSNEE